MRTRRHTAALIRRSVLSLAVCGSLLLLFIPRAYAAEQPCPDGDANTSQGAEDSEGITGDNTTCNAFASAYGWWNIAGGDYSSAFGIMNTASGFYSSAFGAKNMASNVGSSAFGVWNTASGNASSAFGNATLAAGQWSVGFGFQSRVLGDGGASVGYHAVSTQQGGLAMGSWVDRDGNGFYTNDIDSDGDGVLDASSETAYAGGISSVAVGAGVVASANYSSAVGVNNSASGDDSSAFGYYNTASGDGSSAFGYQSQALQANSTALGYRAVANESGVVSFGHSASDLDIAGVAYGSDLDARLIHVADGIAPTDAVNLGQLNTAIGGIAIYSGWNLSADGGAGTLIASGDTVHFEADDSNGNLTVTRTGNTITYGFSNAPTFFGLTVGGGGGNFTIVNNTVINMGGNVVGNLADGVAATDAATVGQLNTVASSAAAAQATADTALGNAATAQTTADNAQASANAAQTTADQAINDAANAQTTADTALANAATAQATAEHAQDSADHAQASADAAQATADTALTVANDAVGTANTYTDTRETAIRVDMASGDADTLTAANAYTDTRSAQTLAAANGYTDQRFAAWNDTFTQYQQQVDRRFAQTDTRIDRIGAMGTAMTQMAVNAAMSNSPRGRIAVGLGAQGGQGAISIGYGRRIGSAGSFSLGASFSSGESSVGAGFGVDL